MPKSECTAAPRSAPDRQPPPLALCVALLYIATSSIRLEGLGPACGCSSKSFDKASLRPESQASTMPSDMLVYVSDGDEEMELGPVPAKRQEWTAPMS